jgi:hypothetical protein
VLARQPLGVRIPAHSGGTWKPLVATRRAVASPIPEDAPVTTASCSLRDISAPLDR